MCRLPIKANQALLVTDRANDIFNINTSAKRLELPNAALLRLYSDGYVTRTVEISGGTINVFQSASAAAIVNNGVVTTNGVGVARLNPASAVTGIIMQAGSTAGQQCWVVNEATLANYVQMAASGTSNVADGTNCVIPGHSANLFLWDSGNSLWLDTGQTVNGTINFVQSSTALDPGNGGTIATNGVGVARINPAANRTDVILQAGLFPGQVCTVINESATNTIAWHTTPSTANIADSATQGVLGTLTARGFVWDSSSGLWYQIKGG